MVRPLATLLRTRPPIFVSWTRRTNLRYSAERVLGDWPWNAMKISCATSSRGVIGRIQRRTVAEALGSGGAGEALGATFLRGAADTLERAQITRPIRRRGTTLLV